MTTEGLDSAELFRRHAAFVSRVIRRQGVPPGDTDDLLQEVFLVAHRNGGYEPGPAKPTTYLARIAILLVRTERRKRRVRAFVQADEERVERAVGTGNPEQLLEQREAIRRAAEVLARTEPKKRRLLLSDIRGETVVSMASALGMNRATVYSQLRAARETFHELVRNDRDSLTAA